MNYYKMVKVDARIHRDIIIWFETGHTIVIKSERFSHAPNDCMVAISKVELLCLMPDVVVLEYTDEQRGLILRVI